jgi:hypothetical protein
MSLGMFATTVPRVRGDHRGLSPASWETATTLV